MASENCHLFDPEVGRGRLRVNKIANKCTTTKARASLPDILELKYTEGKASVFTKRPLPQASQFGPLEAPLVSKQEVEDSNFPMKLDIQKCKRLENADASYIYYDMSDENVCNWFKFVQPAKAFKEQNLCAYQEEDFIHFIATRDVATGEELKVWYSPTYAKFMSVSVLTPTSGVVSMSNVTTGKRRPRKVKASRRMRIYPNSMLSERDVRSVPPKKRGWRRAKDKSDGGIRGGADTFQPEVNYQGAKRVPKKFICPICQKAFKTNSKLKIHSVVHTSRYDFLCYFCGSRFKRKDKLQDHERKVHAANGPPKPKQKLTVNFNNFSFKCQECQIGFFRRGMLLNHLLKKHPDTQADSVEELARPLYKVVRDFLCPHCDKVYKSSTKRKLHILKQHPGRGLPASVKRQNPFSSRTDHNTVMKETVATTPFPCGHCARQYSSKHKRNKHMKEKHPEMEGNKIAQQETYTDTIPQMYSVGHTAFPTISTQPIINNIAAEVCSTPSHSGSPNLYQMNQLSNSNHTVQAGVFCPQSANPQTLTSELTATDRDLLHQAMSELEPVPTATQPTHQYSGYQNARPKGSSYSRYPLGRKRMLKTYEDSQNQLLSQNVTHVQPQPQPEKQLPYKARLLNNDRRNVSWQAEQVGNCGPSAITEVRPPSHSNSHSFPPVLNQQQSLVSMLDPPVNEGTMLLADARSASSDGPVLNEHDVSDFVNGYDNSDSVHWIFPNEYENLSDGYATR